MYQEVHRHTEDSCCLFRVCGPLRDFTEVHSIGQGLNLRISIIVKTAGKIQHPIVPENTIFDFISAGSKEATLLPQHSRIMSYSESIFTISINVGSFALG